MPPCASPGILLVLFLLYPLPPLREVFDQPKDKRKCSALVVWVFGLSFWGLRSANPQDNRLCVLGSLAAVWPAYGSQLGSSQPVSGLFSHGPARPDVVARCAFGA